MITILLLDLIVSALPCRVSPGSSVCNLFYQGFAASTSRRIPGSSPPYALTSLANAAIPGSRSTCYPRPATPKLPFKTHSSSRRLRSTDSIASAQAAHFSALFSSLIA